MIYCWLLLLILPLTALHNVSQLVQIQRIIYKRNAIENTLKDDPLSKCRNGGIFSNGICHCIHPHTGPSCLDFACVHGISVGRRYDPNSLFFNKPCICDEGWQGDLCEYHLTDKCNQRGEWLNDRCECIGSFFGNQCQYTSRCDFGVIKHGRCICQRHFQGDYCERAVCYHGYADVTNHSQSCICPVKYKGNHCDQCSQTGKHILPYPQCVVDYARQQKTTRKKNVSQNKSRIFIIIGSVIFLFLVAILMLIIHKWHQKRKNPQDEALRMQALHERQEMLTKAALDSTSQTESAQNSIVKKERRRSLPFLLKMRRNSSSNIFRVRTDPPQRPEDGFQSS